MSETPHTNDLPATAETSAEAERQDRVVQMLHEADARIQKSKLAGNPPTRFSLLELMIVITLIAVMLGLVRTLGLWGALFSFVGANVWTVAIYPRWHPRDRGRQAAMFDGTWGVVMPLVCFACDPFVFKDQEQLVEQALELAPTRDFSPKFYRGSFAVYAFVFWQMLALFVWMIGHTWLRRFAGFFVGTWALGVMFAGLTGMLLVIPAVIGTFVGIGLLGFTPIFTCFVLARRMREAVDLETRLGSERSAAIFWLLAAFGFMLALLGPLQLVGIGDWFSHDAYFLLRQVE